MLSPEVILSDNKFFNVYELFFGVIVLKIFKQSRKDSPPQVLNVGRLYKGLKRNQMETWKSFCSKILRGADKKFKCRRPNPWWTLFWLKYLSLIPFDMKKFSTPHLKKHLVLSVIFISQTFWSSCWDYSKQNVCPSWRNWEVVQQFLVLQQSITSWSFCFSSIIERGVQEKAFSKFFVFFLVSEEPE